VSYVAALIEELEAHGATDISVDTNHPHPRIIFCHNGVSRFYVTGASPSDRRGLDNALASLRRMIGVRKLVRKSSVVRKRKRRSERPTTLPDTFTVVPDPWMKLRSAENG